jgi:hypothetical protein
MGVPYHRAVSIGALTLHLLAAVTSMLFRAVAKTISELRAVVAAIARQHTAPAARSRHRESGCVF